MLDLLFANREELVGDMVIGEVILGLVTMKKIEFSILGEVHKTTTMDFQRAEFGLFRTPVERVPWEAVFKGKELREDWTPEVGCNSDKNPSVITEYL